MFHPRRKPARGEGESIAGRGETDGIKIEGGSFLSSRGVLASFPASIPCCWPGKA